MSGAGTPAAPLAGAAPFAVTAPPELTLAADRTGSTSFTITNLTGRPVRARLVPKGQNGALDAWLSVVGEPEVPMSVAGTIVVQVKVAVPPDVPAGQHTLFLEVVAEDDTESVAGQSVSFTVPAAVKKKAPPWWLWLIIGLAVLLIGGGVAAFVLTRKPPAPVNQAAPFVSGTPKIGEQLTADPGKWKGQKVTTAVQWMRCAAAGTPCTAIDGATQLTYTQVAADVGQLIGVHVTATNPGGSTSADSPPVGPVADQPPPVLRVPNFVGSPARRAILIAQRMGFKVQVEENPGVGSCIRVIAQSLPEGTVYQRGDLLTLVTIAGPGFC